MGQNGCLRQLEPLKLYFNFTAEFHNSKHASAHSNINDFLINIINYVTPNMAHLGLFGFISCIHKKHIQESVP